MAITEAIGQFWFISLEGHPIGITEQPVVVERPGVNGSAMWRSGIRGEPFILRSGLDTVNLAFAELAYNLYRGIVGTYKDLLWKGMPWTGPFTQVAVLKVTPVKIQAMIGGVGGLNPPSQGWCECDWKLQTVSIV